MQKHGNRSYILCIYIYLYEHRLWTTSVITIVSSLTKVQQTVLFQVKFPFGSMLCCLKLVDIGDLCWDLHLSIPLPWRLTCCIYNQASATPCSETVPCRYSIKISNSIFGISKCYILLLEPMFASMAHFLIALFSKASTFPCIVFRL